MIRPATCGSPIFSAMGRKSSLWPGGTSSPAATWACNCLPASSISSVSILSGSTALAASRAIFRPPAVLAPSRRLQLTAMIFNFFCSSAAWACPSTPASSIPLAAAPAAPMNPRRVTLSLMLRSPKESQKGLIVVTSRVPRSLRPWRFFPGFSTPRRRPGPASSSRRT